MKDVLLDSDGDLYINSESDIEVTDSVLQAIRIRLKWFLGECALYANDVGTDYYGLIFVKNPDLALARSEIRSQILLVDEVTDVPSVSITMNASKRTAVISFTANTDTETFSEEVEICQTMA